MEIVDFKTFVNVSDLSFIKDCLDIRLKVFVDEQKSPLDEEIDELDYKCIHLLMKINKIPIGSLRITDYGEYLRIGRVAVLNEYRGQGYGKQMMKEAIKIIRINEVRPIWVSAQTYVKKFYEDLGFKALDEIIHTIDGIDNIWMTLD